MTSLKLLRMMKGIKQAELADRSGVSRSYLSLIECGWARPSPAFALRIAGALEADASWLFGGMDFEEKRAADGD